MSSLEETKFEMWIREVDSEVAKILGMGASDLPDQNYRDLYEDGFSPKEAARAAVQKIIEDEGLCVEDFGI